MTDEFFKNMIIRIENKMKRSSPYFIKKEIERNAEYLKATFTFRFHKKIDFAIRYDYKDDMFSIKLYVLYIFAEDRKMYLLSEIETLYFNIKNEFINELKTVPSYRLQLLYAEEQVLDDWVKEDIKLWKSIQDV